MTDTGERRIIEANGAGEFTIPAKPYRLYRMLEEKPKIIFQYSQDSRAYFLSTNGDNAPPCEDCPFHAVNPGAVVSFPRCARPACMGVCRG